MAIDRRDMLRKAGAAGLVAALTSPFWLFRDPTFQDKLDAVYEAASKGPLYVHFAGTEARIQGYDNGMQRRLEVEFGGREDRHQLAPEGWPETSTVSRHAIDLDVNGTVDLYGESVRPGAGVRREPNLGHTVFFNDLNPAKQDYATTMYAAAIDRAFETL